jgi:hypothetical protein
VERFQAMQQRERVMVMALAGVLVAALLFFLVTSVLLGGDDSGDVASTPTTLAPLTRTPGGGATATTIAPTTIPPAPAVVLNTARNPFTVPPGVRQ